ncbi:MAG TPA: cytochrome C oxidase subunit IV family protein [Pirellulales bacterium]|jgi:cytochrome c oxidase subunit 4|nr:cytochrome C oxidase subunit IV family protein [Pirellulales bacterium]
MSEHSSQSHGPVVETHGTGPAHDVQGAGAHGHDDHGAHSGHAGHSGGNAKYIYVFIALCFLTTLSFCTTSNWWRSHFSRAESDMMMMAVSCTKALLVILCFMHIWWEANWKFVLTIPAMLMSIFLILMLVPDVGLRLHHASEEKKFYSAEPRPDQPAPRPAEHSATEPES